MKHTPTELKAKGMAVALREEFSATRTAHSKMGWVMPKEVGNYFAIICAKENIATLNKIKGLSKMSQLKLWKLILKNLENE